MTQAQKQGLITKAAATAKAYSDIYHAEEPEDDDFYEAWDDAWAAHQSALVLCPPCSPGDPGDPPPTR